MKHQNIVVTPHLGASTKEAQEKAGNTIAEQVTDRSSRKVCPLRCQRLCIRSYRNCAPISSSCRKACALFAGLNQELPKQINIEFAGEIGGYDNKITELSIVKGLFAKSDVAVSFVNAFSIAEDLGIRIKSINTTESLDYLNAIKIEGGGHSIAGTVVGLKADHRIIMVDDHTVDVPPSEHMIVLK